MSSSITQVGSAIFQPQQAQDMLRRYDELKLQIAQIAQAGKQSCHDTKDDEGERLYQSLLARLVEDRFNLAVLGPFNRGKSTLMNAIIGMDRLPTGVLPHTSVITTVTYGSREKLLIRCAGWSLAQNLPLEKLADYVTEQGNPNNRRRVISAEIQLPSEILRRGLQFIDTPGVNSGIAANTAATESFIPEIDAAIFVSGADSPIDEAELSFLRRIHREIGRVFVVINKLDLLAERDQIEVIKFVRQRLDLNLGSENYRLFGLSAKQALEAKLASKFDVLATTGLPVFEQALTDFLSTSKMPQFYTRMLDRLACLLRRQQLETTILLATDHLELSKNLRQQFTSEVEKLVASASTIASGLRIKLSIELARQLRGVLDGFLNELHSRLSRRFLPPLTARPIIFRRSKAAEGLTRADTFCEQAVREWITTARLISVQPTIERIGGQKLEELKLLPDSVVGLASKLVGVTNDPEPPISIANDNDAQGCEIVLPRPPHSAWKRRTPLWLGFVPSHWFERAVREWFDNVSDAALHEWRLQLETAIQIGAEEYIDRIADRTRKGIQNRARRIAGSIGTKERFRNAAITEELLDRVTRVREALSQSEVGLDKEFDSDRANSVAGTDSGLGEESCPICVCAAEALFMFMSRWQHQLSASEATQTSHADDGGFCSVHTWMYSETASPQGICNAYPPLLHGLSEKLRSRLSSGCDPDPVELAVTLRRILKLSERCPACRVVKVAEQESISNLISRLASKVGISTHPPTLCIEHLYQALVADPDMEVARALYDRTARALERSAENMRHYALKHDALRRNLLTHEERIAYFLALARVAGDKRLVPRWTRDEL